MVLYTDHEYDSSDRIKSQGWKMGSEAFEEAYTYNSADGTLNTMTVDGEELSFGYDHLKRLDTKTLAHVNGSSRTGILAMDLTYRDIPGTEKTTTQVQGIRYLKPGTDEQVIPEHVYSYDARGNISKVEVAGRTGGRSAEHPLRQYNALKYRGYYYDAETGFYYVSSRYYGVPS